MPLRAWLMVVVWLITGWIWGKAHDSRVDWVKTDSQGESVGQRAAVNKGKTVDLTGSTATLRLPSTVHAISRSWPLTRAAKQRIRFCIQCPGIQIEKSYKPRVEICWGESKFRIWSGCRRRWFVDIIGFISTGQRNERTRRPRLPRLFLSGLGYLTRGIKTGTEYLFWLSVCSWAKLRTIIGKS